MLDVVALITGAFVIAVTTLSLLRSKAWWIRVWDFPRVQLALLGAASLTMGWFSAPLSMPWMRPLFFGALALAIAYQAARVWRYSPLAPKEVQLTRASADTTSRLSIAVSNVLQTNRDAERLIAVLRSAAPDLILCVETDDWWRERLDVLEATHPHTVKHPQENTYGMLLYSRLPLEDTSIEFLVEPDVPSIHANVRMPSGQRVWLHCLHPRPPAPGESDESLERDAELLLVGKRVRDATAPVIVCGDLNDVAWSRTTRLFQKTSRLLDPRKGRGLYNTFHAGIPGLRFPLDHIFHSENFRLVAMHRLPAVGSDHFPVYASLSHEPSAESEQQAPLPDEDDKPEVDKTIAKAMRRATNVLWAPARSAGPRTDTVARPTLRSGCSGGPI
jgi:endonuclease/exonuclease/phosphatase (EEP) superfamily protein YafD